MKKYILTGIMLLLLAAVVTLYGKINPVTGQSEGTAWEQFSANLAKNPTALAAFRTGMGITVTGTIEPGPHVAEFLADPSLVTFAELFEGSDKTGTGKVLLETSPTLVTPILGVAAATSVAATGTITSSSPTAGIGYVTGAGGTVTQGSSRTTTAVLSKIAGQITTTADSMAALTPTTFTVTNTAVALGDVVQISKVSGDIDTVADVNSVAAGSFTVTLYNRHATDADTTAFVFNFVVIKGATS